MTEECGAVLDLCDRRSSWIDLATFELGGLLCQCLPHRESSDCRILNADPREIYDGDLLDRSSSRRLVYEEFAERHSIALLNKAAFDAMMKFPKLGGLPTIVDRDHIRASEDVGSELLLCRLVRADGGHMSAWGEPLRLNQGAGGGRSGDDDVSLVYRMFN